MQLRRLVPSVLLGIAICLAGSSLPAEESAALADLDELAEEDDLFAVLSALPGPPMPKMSTRSLDPESIALGNEVDQLTGIAKDFMDAREFERAAEALSGFAAEKVKGLDEYSRASLASVNFNLGTRFLKMQDYVLAIEAYERSAALDSITARTAYSLGTCYRKAGKYDEAIRTLQKAVELDPKMAAGWFSLGSAYRKKKDLKSAQEAYEEAIEHDPGHVAANFMIGSLAWQKADYDSAATAWRKVLALNPNHSKAKTWLAKAEANAGPRARGVRG